MKFAAAALGVILALLSLNLLSPFAMDADMMAMGDHGTSHCIAATAAQSVCPNPATDNDFATARFHSDFLSNFSSAVFGGSLLLLVLACTLLLARLFGSSTDPLIDSKLLYIRAAPIVSAITLQTRAWYSLLEHSPTFALARVA